MVLVDRLESEAQIEKQRDELEKQAGPLLRAKGVDWNAVRKEFDAAAKTVDSDVAHVELCGRLLARLQDGHAAFTRVDVAMPERAPQHGVGLSFCEVEKKVLVKQAFGPAAASASSATTFPPTPPRGSPPATSPTTG